MEGRRGTGREEVKSIDENEETNLVAFEESSRKWLGLVKGVVAGEME